MTIPVNYMEQVRLRLLIAKIRNEEEANERFLAPYVEKLKAIQKGEERLEAAIGKFVRKWTSLENALYKVLVQYSGVSREVGKAIFSGTRVAQVINFVKAIGHNTAMDSSRAKDFERLSAQIMSINAARDLLVHHFHDNVGTVTKVSLSDDETPIITKDKVSRVGHEQRYLISEADIDNMHTDMEPIKMGLEAHRQEQFAPHIPLDAQLPWLYRPRQP
jgi:hypothetical protein